MKKILFSLLAILLFGQLAISQSTFGLEAGGNVSYRRVKFTSLSSTTEHINTTSIAGGQVGFFYKLNVDKKLTLASGLNFSLIGSKEPYLTYNHFDSNYVSHNYNNRIGYVELPVSVQYNLHHFYIGAGPSVAFKILTKGVDASYSSIFQTMDVAANLLLGYKIVKKWDVNVRYNCGLLDITKANYEYNYGGIDKQNIKNRFVSLSLLYHLK